MKELRAELAELAEQARPVDLVDRVYATSRRMRRRRRAMAAGGVAITAAVVAGIVYGPPEKDTTPVLSPESKAGMPFVPPTVTYDGRVSMALKLPDGTQVRLGFPESADFSRWGMTADITTDEKGSLCCTFSTWLPKSAGQVGVVRSASGDAPVFEISNDDFYSGPDGTLDKDGGPISEGTKTGTKSYWMKQGSGWYVRLTIDDALVLPKTGARTDVTKYFPIARRLRSTTSTMDGAEFPIAGYPTDSIKVPVSGPMSESSLSGPSVSFSQWGPPYRTVTVAEVWPDCDPAGMPNVIETDDGWQICKDRIVVRWLGMKDDHIWIQTLKDGLTIEEVART